MISRLERTGENVRRVAARLYPEIAPELLVPRAAADLFTDPVDLESAVFASQLVDRAAEPPPEGPASDITHLQPLIASDNRGWTGAGARDLAPAADRTRETTRLAKAPRRPTASTIARTFGATLAPTAAAPHSQRPGTNAAARSTKSRFAASASIDDAAAGAMPPAGAVEATLGHALSPVAPLPSRVLRDVSTDREAPSTPAANANEHFLRAAPASAPRTRVQELVSNPPATSFDRTAPVAQDEGVTRWVKGAAGLASLFAPPRPVAPATPTAPLPQSSSSSAGVDAAPPLAAAVPASAGPNAQTVSTDVELLMDELERRLELEYLRHYGTSGR